MITLRTPKHVTGPDLGLPSLTVRAWFEAQHGAAAWEALGKIPKETWQDYLTWYRRVLGLPIENDAHVSDIEPHGAGCYALAVDGPAGKRRVLARRVVIATGIDGSGVWEVPPLIRDAVPEALYAHTAQAIDFASLKGRRIGVLGAGASAFDNAATALEQGAGRVELFFRRERLPEINPYRWMEFTGFLRHYADLDDARRWRFMRHIFTMNQPPPSDTFERAARHDNFTLHGHAGWSRLRNVGDRVEVTTTAGKTHEFDFLIIGTGFLIDLAMRQELARLAPHVALWRDRYTPPAEEANALLAGYPYLGKSFEFTERDTGSAPWLGGIHNFTFGATISMGLSGSSISALKFAVPRLVQGLTRSLFTESADAHFDSLLGYDVKELELPWPAA